MAFVFLPNSYAVSDEKIVYIDDESSTKDWAVTIYDRGDFLVKGKDGKQEITINRNAANIGGVGRRYASKNMDKIIFDLDKLNINLINKGDNVSAIGGGASQLDASKTDIFININQKKTDWLGRGEIYGVLAGSSVTMGINGDNDNFNSSQYAIAEFKNLDIKQNSDASTLTLNNALRAIQGAYRDSGTGPAGKIIVNGDTSIYLNGARQEAIYVSGKGKGYNGNEGVISSVILKGNTNIILNNAAGSDNSAIKIGKTRQIGTGQGYFESMGNLSIDMKNSKGSAVKLAVSGSELKADFDSSSTNIKTNGNAINIGQNDWGTQLSANGIKASFKNANFETTSTNDSLLKVFQNQGRVLFNFNGERTNLVMRDDQSWLIDIDNSKENGYENKVTLNLNDSSKIMGLSNIDGNSELILNLSDSLWHLNENKYGSISSFTTLNLNDSSKLIAENNNFTLNGTVNNTSGIIDLVNHKDINDKTKLVILTINGNYTGGNIKPTDAIPFPDGNSQLIVNTIWNNDNDSVTDLLHIKGTATGYTQVQTQNSIIGNVTRGDAEKYSVPVVTVDNHKEGANAFYGFADTTGAAQALLVQKDANNYTWYLAKNDTPVDPVDPVGPVNPVKPEVSGFIRMPTANMEMGYNLIRTLHERVSEQQTMAWDDCTQCQSTHRDDQVWGKMLGNLARADGDNRYGYRSKMWGGQFGYDFNVNYNENTGSRRHSGMMVTYAHDTLKFNDRRSVFFDTGNGQYAEKDKRTGTGKSDMVALGAYTTFYDKNGSYLDLVGNLDYIHNKYESVRGSESSNDSYGVAVSGEVGRPFALTDNGISNGDWEIEPQAQLIYQYRTFSNFKTEHDVSVNQKDRHGLRGRAGVRLAYNTGTPELKTNTIYFVSNVVHDFIDNDQTVKIGSDSIKEKTASTFGEVGGGIQLPVGETSYLYMDARYSHSLSNSDGKADNMRGNLGFKYHF
ncbi:autotransporter outer membrane beta-barrel domain-containing protein [Morganella morganii]|uniref:autotransporter family protein n=1 Tax=Morganella morganii TaxID=582 RepID=UPI003A851D57